MTTAKPEVSPYPISICLLPARAMIPAILSFHMSATNQHRYSKLILVYDEDVELLNGMYEFSGNVIDIQHIRFLEDAYSIACQLNFLCNLMVWDNEISDALNPTVPLGTTLGKLTSSFTQSAVFIFFPDGWVGMSYPSKAQKNFIHDHAINCDQCLELHLIRSANLAKEFHGLGMPVLTVDAAHVRDSLLVCSQYLDRLSLATSTSPHSLNSSQALKCLFLVMRAWNSKTFHDGLYSFGSESPIDSVVQTIHSSLRHAGVRLEDFDKIIVCADSRTSHLYNDEELIHKLSASAPGRVQTIAEHLGTIIPQGLSLDYILPPLLEVHDSTVYSFDSNTPVPFWLANIHFKSVIGAPVETMLSQNANQIQIDYVTDNIERLTCYCNTSSRSNTPYLIMSINPAPIPLRRL